MALADDWRRYIGAIKHNAPEYPIEGRTAFQLNQASANRVASVCSGILEGLNRSLPPQLGLALGLATAENTAARVDAVNDALIGWSATLLFGAANAVPVGGVVALVRGGYQSLQKSRQTIAYSNQLVGYASTFAASAVATAGQANGQRIVLRKGPQPSGYAALPTNLPYFRDGCSAAMSIMQWMNQRPAHNGAPTPGYLLFAGFGQRYRHRYEIENFFYRSILLGRSKDSVLEELRVWAR